MADKERGSPEWPAINEKHWYAVAIVAAIFVAIGALFGYFWVFAAGADDAMVARVRILTPLGTLAIALVTFATVAWRGMVTSRQADEQKRQNDASESANFADLLERGAKLLGEKERVGDRRAGLALLNVVIREPQKRFATEAMDIMGQYYIDNYPREFSRREALDFDPVVKDVRQAMIDAVINHDVYSKLQAEFDISRAPNLKKNRSGRWPPIGGFTFCAFNGGVLWRANKVRDQSQVVSTLTLNHDHFFDGVVFQQVRIPARLEHINCSFEECDFEPGTELHWADYQGSRFVSCDFSGTVFRGQYWINFLETVFGRIEETPEPRGLMQARHNHYKLGKKPQLRDYSETGTRNMPQQCEIGPEWDPFIEAVPPDH